MENRAGQRGLVGALLQDGQGVVPLVPEGEALHLAALDENILRRSIQHKSLDRLDFAGGNGSPRLDAGHNDFARFVRIKDSVIRADSSARAVNDLEGHAGQRLILRTLDKLLDNQGCAGLIVKNEAVGYAGAYNDVFRRLVQNVACGGFHLADHNGGVRLQPGDCHCTIRAGDVPAVIGSDGPAFAVPNQEFRLCQRLLGDGVPLQDGEGAEGIVIEADGLCVRGVDNHGLGRGVFPVMIRRFFLRHYIRSRQQLGEDDLAVAVRGVEAVGTGQPLIVGYEFPAGGGDFELRTMKGLLGDGIVLFND